MMNGGYGFAGGGIFGIIISIVMVIGIVFLVGYLFVSFSRSNNNNDRTEKKTSLQILEERYAHGEIGEEEFKQKKKTLKN